MSSSVAARRADPLIMYDPRALCNWGHPNGPQRRNAPAPPAQRPAERGRPSPARGERRVVYIPRFFAASAVRWTNASTVTSAVFAADAATRPHATVSPDTSGGITTTPARTTSMTRFWARVRSARDLASAGVAGVVIVRSPHPDGRAVHWGGSGGGRRVGQAADPAQQLLDLGRVVPGLDALQRVLDQRADAAVDLRHDQRGLLLRGLAGRLVHDLPDGVRGDVRVVGDRGQHLTHQRAQRGHVG